MRRSMATRSALPVRENAGKARLAAAMARRASSASASGPGDDLGGGGVAQIEQLFAVGGDEGSVDVDLVDGVHGWLR